MRIACIFSALALFPLLFSPTVGYGAADGARKIDTKKSEIKFVGSKPDGKHDGGFKEFAGTVLLDADGSSLKSISIEIKTQSLWSDNPKLTAHLKTADFFDVRKHPKLEFTSTAVRPGDAQDSLLVEGKLTMLGRTKQVKIPVKLVREPEGMMLKADFAIDRTEFGMDYGVGKVDKKVKVSAGIRTAGS